jgi:hypothetical protein
MFALIAAVLLFLKALLALFHADPGDVDLFTFALGFWALHFAWAVPLRRGPAQG